MSCISIFIWIGGTFLYNLIAFVYPAYLSYKAVEKRNIKELKYNLEYWIVFAFLYILSPFLEFIPYWKIINYFAVIMLWSSKGKGSRAIYKNFLRKILKRYE